MKLRLQKVTLSDASSRIKAAEEESKLLRLKVEQELAKERKHGMSNCKGEKKELGERLESMLSIKRHEIETLKSSHGEQMAKLKSKCNELNSAFSKQREMFEGQIADLIADRARIVVENEMDYQEKLQQEAASTQQAMAAQAAAFEANIERHRAETAAKMSQIHDAAEASRKMCTQAREELDVCRAKLARAEDRAKMLQSDLNYSQREYERMNGESESLQSRIAALEASERGLHKKNDATMKTMEILKKEHEALMARMEKRRRDSESHRKEELRKKEESAQRLKEHLEQQIDLLQAQLDEEREKFVNDRDAMVAAHVAEIEGLVERHSKALNDQQAGSDRLLESFMAQSAKSHESTRQQYAEEMKALREASSSALEASVKQARSEIIEECRLEEDLTAQQTEAQLSAAKAQYAASMLQFESENSNLKARLEAATKEVAQLGADLKDAQENVRSLKRALDTQGRQAAAKETALQEGIERRVKEATKTQRELDLLRARATCSSKELSSVILAREKYGMIAEDQLAMAVATSRRAVALKFARDNALEDLRTCDDAEELLAEVERKSALLESARKKWHEERAEAERQEASKDKGCDIQG